MSTKTQNIEFFLLLVFSIVLVTILPSFFDIIEPDSLGYINNSISRKNLYPFVLDVFDVTETKNHKLIKLFQILILCLSIVLLIETCRKVKIICHTRILLYILIFFNIYYVSFSKTILTESLFFSFINFSIAVMFNIFFNNKNQFLLLGLCLGFILAIKSIGLILFGTFLLSILVFKTTTKKNLIGLFLGISIFPIIELCYQKNKNLNESHNTIILRSILGKVFIISGKENFDTSRFEKEKIEFLDKLREESIEINKYLSKIKNPYLYLDLIADYEVLGQYQVIKLNKENESEIKEIFLEILKLYPLDYIKISLSHYLGLWLPGSKRIFLNDYSDNRELIKMPNKLKLDMVAGNILELPTLLLLANLIFFNIIFIVFSLCTFFTIKRILRFRANIFDLLVISIQLYLLSVAFLNVSTPRYFMAIYPLTLVILAIRVEKRLIKKSFEFFS
ncbi:MAG: hypothetical protein CMN01_01615 [Rickettsiales bacterium]|nr:hypothetical protein [Rickettsiales bacterium]